MRPPDPRLAAARGLRDQPRHDDRQRRAADAGARAARVQQPAAVDRRRLQPGVRRAAAGAGEPLRPRGPQGHAAGGPGGVRRRERRGRLRRRLRAADRRALLHGPGRGDGVPRDAVADLEHLHRALRARAGDRPVGRDRGRGDRAGTDRRRLAARRFTWPSIFFAMAPVALRGGRLVACSVPTSRDLAAPRTDRAGTSRCRRPRSRCWSSRSSRRRNSGWGSARTLAGFVGAARLCWRRFFACERRMREPMLDVELFRNPRFTAACAAVTVVVLHPVRLHLPDHPVLPVHQGLQPAVGGRAPAAGGRRGGRRLGARHERGGALRHEAGGRRRAC